MQKREIQFFTSGIHNLIQDNIIPDDAASDANGWVTEDGRIKLSYGRETVGDFGESGKIYMQHVGYRADGTPVHYRKAGDTIQAYQSGSWVDVITGLTEDTEYIGSNYQSLAGAFTYFFGPDGIYKVCNANPTDYVSLYDEAKNFKGYGLIDKGRTILWGRAKDPTGLYGSYIDGQDGDVYTTVTGEILGSSGSTHYTGTLAFKSGGSTRTCFGVSITDGTETFTDDFNGNLTGDAGGTGTINYTTGEYDVTFNATTTANVTADYQWEDSNEKGVTDFTKSSPRQAGEGFIVRQDAGGDEIKTVIPLDGSYFSLKANSCYKFTLDAADENPTNEIFRTDIGVKTIRSAVGTGIGIVFLNSANESKPRLNIIERNPLGDNFINKDLFDHFKFEAYDFSDVAVDSWDSYIIIATKSDDTQNDNNRILLCNIKNNSVDSVGYNARVFSKDDGILYAGDSISETTYKMFSGFDDLGYSISNYWISKDENYENKRLKKVKKLRIRGSISPEQNVSVYISTDDSGFTKVGTIRGVGNYVSQTDTRSIGTYMVGSDTIGGSDSVNISDYYMEIKLKLPKFQSRRIKFVADDIGYFDVASIEDVDIWQYQEKIPSKYRIKQNVSLNGQDTDLSNPEF